jgi:nucleoside 2-deoxyribosyltransferase
MNKSIVYLGGPITGKSYTDANAWRLDAARHFSTAGIESINPLVRETQFKEHNDLGLEAQAHDQPAIFAGDIYDLRRSDILLANFVGATCVSGGTLIELGIAYAERKEIIIVLDSLGLHDGIILRGLTPHRFLDLCDALNFITRLYRRYQ